MLVVSPHEHRCEVFNVGDVRGEIAVGSCIAVGVLEGNRQFGRWIDIAREHVGDAVSHLLARLPSADNGIGKRFPRCRFNRAADIQQHNDMLSDLAVGLTHLLYQGLLLGVEVEIGLCSVDGLTAFSSDGDDGALRLVDSLLHFFG